MVKQLDSIHIYIPCSRLWKTDIVYIDGNLFIYMYLFSPLSSLSASTPRLVYQMPWYVLSCLWDGAYKRTLAVNR